MADRGIDVELLCLRATLTDAEGARQLKSRFRVRSAPYVSLPVIGGMLKAMVTKPGWFFSSLTRAIADTASSPKILIKTLGIFPKCCYFATQLAGQDVDRLMAFWASLPARASWWISGYTGIPFVTWAHAGADIYHKAHQTDAALRTVIEGADFVLTCNQANIVYFGKMFSPETMKKVHYHPHGVDLERFQPKSNGGTQGETRIHMLSVGRLTEAKGFHYAIDACVLLKERGIPFSYRIVGEGPMREQIVSTIEANGLGDSITLLGYQEQSNLPPEYERADIYLAPSVVAKTGGRDGLPNVVLEAMASGVPVVGSDAVGIPEAVEHEVNGLLFPPADPSALADAIQSLASRPAERAVMGQNAAKLVQARYGRRQCMDRIHQIYRTSAQDVPEWPPKA